MDDRQWFRDNLDFLKERYEGKLVAVLDGTIVAVGDSLEEVIGIIDRKRKSGEISGVPYTGRADDLIAAARFPPLIP